MFRYRKLFVKYSHAAARAYEIGGKRGAMIALEGFKNGLRPILLANITAAITTFGERTIANFNRNKKAAESAFDLAVQAYLQQHGLTKIEQITDTTRDQILSVIAAGEAEGLALAEISAKIVAETGGLVARRRAHTIAITETHSAATFGSDMAAAATGLPLMRVWLSAEDSRTRPTHVAALLRMGRDAI